jgi:25S rRNA (uracil2843-N3)-methyltransferase
MKSKKERVLLAIDSLKNLQSHWMGPECFERQAFSFWSSITYVHNLPRPRILEPYFNSHPVSADFSFKPKTRLKMGPKKTGPKQQAAVTTFSRKQKQSTKRPDTKSLEREEAKASDINSGLQQLLLDIFRNTFISLLDGDTSRSLQEVKQHLYNRDFQAAFSKEEYLEAYAARWSSSRALGYIQIFSEIFEYKEPHRPPRSETLSDAGQLVEYSSSHGNVSRALCLGGGAGAELVALAGVSHLYGPSEGLHIHVDIVDIASWERVVQKLYSNATTSPPISAYASAAAKAANIPLADEGHFHHSFTQADILDPANQSSLIDSIQDHQLITLMFTLNELYTLSMTRTTQLLLSITEVVKSGTLLLVVDSPGSYSTVAVAGSEKLYPMKWLLDHTLLETGANESGETRWKEILSDDSRWFRLPQGLRYTIDLENMRYQIHLYQAR